VIFNCDKIIVFDLEATCWEGRENAYKSREIISLGACILDIKSLGIVDKFHMICKPEKTEVSEYCTRITGITKEQAENGVDFEFMCKSLMEKLNTRSYPCAAWGQDSEKLYYDCRTKQCKYPFSNECVNISLLYSIMTGKPYNNGLQRSLAELGMKFEGDKHDPYWDSYNAARVLKHLMEKCREAV
jgi:inhibitor of KinA sporulation pathway (predicted exonuclease)